LPRLGKSRGVTDQPSRLAPDPARVGVLLGIGAYLIWGLLPLFLHLFEGVSPVEIVAHRVLWSLLLLAAAASLSGKTRAIVAALRQPGVLPVLLASSVLIAANWTIYAYAVLNQHVLEASLGYFINPLVNVLLGVIVLKERLRRPQIAAVAVAALGVMVLAVANGASLGIPLGLAFSFGLYGLLRKMAPVDAFAGLTIETVLIAPFAAGVLVWAAQGGHAAWGESGTRDLLLIASGPITAAPLLLFAAAAKRLRYATLGVLQYIAPTLQFLQGWLLFGETLTPVHLVTFGCIWAGLALYAIDGLRHARIAPAPLAPE
jgi:chloramphenicol-sensitive protein RarD